DNEPVIADVAGLLFIITSNASHLDRPAFCQFSLFFVGKYRFMDNLETPMLGLLDDMRRRVIGEAAIAVVKGRERAKSGVSTAIA
ncbi:hypothetical protein ACCT04_35830, partial [Rhizobium ruizarguesonis]